MVMAGVAVGAAVTPAASRLATARCGSNERRDQQQPKKRPCHINHTPFPSKGPIVQRVEPASCSSKARIEFLIAQGAGLKPAMALRSQDVYLIHA